MVVIPSSEQPALSQELYKTPKNYTVIASGNWDNVTNSGTRTRNVNNARSTLNGNNSSRSRTGYNANKVLTLIYLFYIVALGLP